jgi:hypothetical protein
VAYGNPAQIRDTVAPDVPLDRKAAAPTALGPRSITKRFSGGAGAGARQIDPPDRGDDGRFAASNPSPDCLAPDPAAVALRSGDRATAVPPASSSSTKLALKCDGSCGQRPLRTSDLISYGVSGLSFLLSLFALITAWCRA